MSERRGSDPQPLRIIFAGTPDFAVPSLEALIDAGLRPLGVWTQPDRPAGRGRRLTPSPVKECATRHGIDVHQPVSLRDPEARAVITGAAPDLMVVVAYGLLLPPEVLAIPRVGCWNVHASLLPRWRGAAPIQRAIEAGDDETGVSLMQMEAGLDTGPVMRRRATPITDCDTGGSLHDRLARLGAETLLEGVEALAAGRPFSSEPQDDTRATHAAKLTKAEAELDFSEPAERLARRIRAFDPWPVCWFERDGERLRVWSAHAVATTATAEPGTILPGDSASLEVATGDGTLRITEVQRPGGRRQPAEAYLRARPAGTP